jgi:hypothetical protein
MLVKSYYIKLTILKHEMKTKNLKVRGLVKSLITGMILVLICGMFLQCGSAAKLQQNAETRSAFISFMDEKSFEFRADTAYPMITQAFTSVANSGLLPPGSTAGAIQIIDVANYVKVYGDSVSGVLPFYGERQFGGGPMSQSGIEFKGVPDTYTQAYNEDKGQYNITFEISSETGRHRVTMMIFPSKTATVLVTGNQRNSIRFKGKIMPIETEAMQ